MEIKQDKIYANTNKVNFGKNSILLALLVIISLHHNVYKIPNEIVVIETCSPSLDAITLDHRKYVFE